MSKPKLKNPDVTVFLADLEERGLTLETAVATHAAAGLYRIPGRMGTWTRDLAARERLAVVLETQQKDATERLADARKAARRAAQEFDAAKRIASEMYPRLAGTFAEDDERQAVSDLLVQLAETARQSLREAEADEKKATLVWSLATELSTMARLANLKKGQP